MGKTLIKVSCVDQRLVTSYAPLVASGGMSEDEVDFSFCPLWDGFTKTAVFYRDGGTVYHVLLSDDKATIPQEVLKDEGTLYFGVFGVKDGVRRTSEVLRYKIKAGAITTGTTPPDPTPDIYSQLLTKVTSAENKVTALETKVDNISVGGRNLLTQASCKANEYYTESATWRSGYGVTLPTTSNNPTFQTSNLNGGGAFVVGETYTLSFTAKANGTTNVYTDLYPDTIGGIFGNAKREVTTTPRKIVMTDVLTSSADLGNVYFRFWRLASEPKYEIQVWDIKLEKGNKATDWSPAPEDVYAEIAKLKAAIIALGGNV